MLTFACPHCGQSVSLEPPQGDQSLQCPHCSETVQLSAKSSDDGNPTIVLTFPARVQQNEPPAQPVTQAQITDTTQDAAGSGADVDPRVHLVLAQWEKAWRDGKDLPPEELVHDCPEILPQVLKGIDAMRALADIVNFTAYIVPTMSELPGGEPPEHPDVPGYEIIKELGHGGMGVVYQAHQKKLGRLVALKMLLTHAPVKSQQLNRFRREAKTIANLDHPNIVQLYDFGQYKKRPYFTLEFVSGGDLAKRLKREPLPVEAAITLMEKLAHAIAYAHREGVIHRDLKPQNILLTPDGIPKITDFGLVKQMEQGDGGTETDVIMGSPPYMPPEQAQGMNREVGRPADVYSLGAILYECLTGRPPFIAPSPMETLKRVTEEDPVPPRRLQPAIPKDVETVCLKCLRKDPTKRYDSAESLAEDLRRIRTKEPILARPVNPVERVVKWVKRRPTAASLLGGAALLISVTVVAVIWAFGIVLIERNKLKEKTKELETKNQELKKEREAKQRLRLENDWSEHGRKLREALTLRDTGDRPAALKTLEKCRWDFRGWVYDRLRTELTAERRDEILIEPAQPILDFALSKGGTRVVTAGENGAVQFWDALSGEFLANWKFTSPGKSKRPLVLQQVALNLNATKICATASDGSIVIWDPATKMTIDQRRLMPGPKRPVAFHPTNSQVAFVGDDPSTIALHDFHSKKRAALLEGHGQPITGLAFNAIGRWLACGADDGTVLLWEVSKRRTVSELDSHAKRVTCVAFSRDDQWIATAGDDHVIKLSRVADGKLQRNLTGHTAKINGLAFHPNCRLLFSSDEKEGLYIWHLPTERLLLKLPTKAAQGAAGLAISDDGRTLAFHDGAQVHVWKNPPPETVRPIDAGGSSVVGLAYGEDGPSEKWLAYTTSDSAIHVWDMVRGMDLGALLKHRDQVNSVAFAPNKRLLASAGKDGKIFLWQIGSQKPVAQLLAHGKSVTDVAFSTDGATLASSSMDKTVMIWDVARRQRIGNPLDKHTAGVSCVSFDASGKWLASGGMDGSVLLWNAKKLKLVHTLSKGTSPITSLAFGIGPYLAASSNDGVISIWNIQTGDVHLQWKVKAAAVSRVVFSPDGKWLVSAGDDKVVRIWNPLTGKEAKTLQGHKAGVTNLAFSSDGEWLISGDRNGQIKCWKWAAYAPTK